MKNEIIIRQAKIEDSSNLAVLKQQVWISTYATEGIRSEFSDYVLGAFTRDKLIETLKDSNTILFIAEINKHLVGCIEINSRPEDCITAVKALPEITVLYVLERFARKGIGSMLLNHAIGHLYRTGYTGVWLSVYHQNLDALMFYNKFKFEQVGVIYFEMNGNKYENKVLLKEIL